MKPKEINKLKGIEKEFQKKWYTWCADTDEGYVFDHTPNEVWSWIKGSLLKVREQTRRETIEEVRKRLEKLVDKKRAEELSKQFQMFFGQDNCNICGYDPKKQREMLLDSLDKR